MDRELLLFALVLSVAAPLLWAGGLVARPIPLGASARATERARWVAVWVPALLPALTACALVTSVDCTLSGIEVRAVERSVLRPGEGRHDGVGVRQSGGSAARDR